MTRLPKYVQGFVDHTGAPRHYIRRQGYPRTALPGTPWSPTFMAAYEEAMAQQDDVTPPKVAGVKPGTLRALVVSYFGSPAFSTLSDASKLMYRGTLERFCKTKDANGNLYGDKPYGLDRAVIVKILAARAGKPRVANQLRTVLAILMRHAVEQGMRRDNPVREIKPLKVKSKGYHSWTEAEIEQFEAHWPIGSRERLALALLLYTGQRGRSDVTRMGRQHLVDTDEVPSGKFLRVTQKKTDADLVIPVHMNLLLAIEQTPSDHLTFITTQYGKPFSPAAFGNWFRDACRAAGLRHCSAHGLRKANARRIADAGGSEHEIASVTGHASLSEVRRYTRGANQKKLAIAAMAKIK